MNLCVCVCSVMDDSVDRTLEDAFEARWSYAGAIPRYWSVCACVYVCNVTLRVCL